MEKAEQKLRQSSEYVVHVSEGSKKILDSTGVRGGETLEDRTKNVRHCHPPVLHRVRPHSLLAHKSVYSCILEQKRRRTIHLLSLETRVMHTNAHYPV